MFDLTLEETKPNGFTRHRVILDGSPMSFESVIDAWRHDQSFRSFYSQALASSAFQGFRWESPALTIETAQQPFEFVLINSPSFCKRPTDFKTFEKKFADKVNHDVIKFSNLRGDATMIVPTPKTDSDVYGHFASFIRNAPESQIDAIWQLIGETVLATISKTPIWLSTAGGGVAWLHVRIDSSPKYYKHAPYRSITSGIE
jgi:hypothetical protein